MPSVKVCPTRLPRAAQWLVLLLVVVSATGCVRRRLTVRSNPPGAMVYVDNQSIGTTPCSMDFNYYGTREIRLVKSGYETLTVNQPIPAPWYQVWPLDLLSDNFALHKIRDNRTVSFELQPQMMLSTEEIIRRGEELRTRNRMEQVLPASATSPVPPAMPINAPPPNLAPPGGFTPQPMPPVSAAPQTPWP